MSRVYVEVAVDAYLEVVVHVSQVQGSNTTTMIIPTTSTSIFIRISIACKATSNDI